MATTKGTDKPNLIDRLEAVAARTPAMREWVVTLTPLIKWAGGWAAVALLIVLR